MKSFVRYSQSDMEKFPEFVVIRHCLLITFSCAPSPSYRFIHKSHERSVFVPAFLICLGSEGIVEDVVLLGAPVSGDYKRWAHFSRVVAGRIINGYCRLEHRWISICIVYDYCSQAVKSCQDYIRCYHANTIFSKHSTMKLLHLYIDISVDYYSSVEYL